MKCPVCVDKGLRSRVDPVHYAASCGVAYELVEFWDEEGNFHQHDHHARTQDFSCTNGHSWSSTLTPRCESCDFGDDEPTVKIDERIREVPA